MFVVRSRGSWYNNRVSATETTVGRSRSDKDIRDSLSTHLHKYYERSSRIAREIDIPSYAVSRYRNLLF